MAVKDGKILAVGAKDEVLKPNHDATRLIELDHSAGEPCEGSHIPGFKPVCGDGCFNHGLSVMLRAVDPASQPAP